MHAPQTSTTVAPITAMIEVVEPVGNEIFVYFSTGAATHIRRAVRDRPTHPKSASSANCSSIHPASIFSIDITERTL